MENSEKPISSFVASPGFKLGLIAVLTLLLLIPASMIRELITERELRRNETITEVTSVWGNEQTLCGPVLTVPVEQVEENDKGVAKTMVRYAHFLPEALKIEGTIEPEVRYRGIYKVITYHTRLHFSGSYAPVSFEGLSLNSEKIKDNLAWLELGIPDMRGINQEIRPIVNDDTLDAVPGIPSKELSVAGVHCKVPLTLNKGLEFSFELDLNGSHALNFVPIGKTSEVLLSSSWNSPSFGGAFLPDSRDVNKQGFSASWKILQLNRNYPQQWIGDQYSVSESVFGVSLITPVDTYQKSMRSVKYALLFIGFTFIIFFFAEIITRVRIHPIQYVLTGIALCIFYSLLTALAEHINFALAYLISSISIISIISIFAYSLYKNFRVMLILTGSLLVLYVYLYIILQLSDYALLFGNIGLVIVIALVMYFSRRIDWYSSLRRNEPNSL
jgi:inner membrane protein